MKTTLRNFNLILIISFIFGPLFAQNPDNRINDVTSSWIGNSFPGGSKWVQHNILKAQVHANGEIHVYSNWDEAHQEGAKYQGKRNPDETWYGDKIGHQSETDAYHNVIGDSVTLDGVVWYIEGYKDPENVSTPGRTDRQGTKVKKSGTSIEISDLEKATSLGIDRKNNLLMITDDGPARHTVRFYNTDGQFVKELGIPGGIWPEQVGGDPSMNGVIDSDLKFWDLVGCGTDEDGNIIVVMSDNWRQSGAVIKAFDPAGSNMLWELHSNSFCDIADADRNFDGTIVYGAMSKYQMDYSKPVGKQYTKVAHTLNPYKYPNDWRLTDGNKNTGSAMVRYVGGKKFIYYTGMHGGLSIYKFNSETDGEIAIPSEQRFGTGGKNHLDVDDNGDYYELLYDLQKIRKTPAESVDANGDIIWGTPVIYDRPTEFEKILACSYVGGSDDEMLIGGFFPGDADQTGWKHVGKRLVKYKNWNTNPTLVWSHHFTTWYHMDDAVAKRVVNGNMHAAGDYVFVDWGIYNYNGPNRQNSPGVIDVYNLNNGEKVGEIFSGPETMYQSSWHDLLISFHVMQRTNGEYIILSEENWKSKHLMFQWCPSGDCSETADTEAPSVPMNLTASNITATSFTLSWTASTDNVIVSGYEVFADGVLKGTTASTSLSVAGLTCATSYSVTVKARDAIGNWSDASSAEEVSTTFCDTEAPTVPTNLTTSNKTETSFTLSWTGSTDNVDVTGYEVFADGISQGTTATTSLNIMGLTCATAYSLTVKATDDAGNWSAASDALIGSTSECGVIDPTLLVWWKLDETSGITAHDATGNGRNGTLLNGLEFTGEAGIIGNALTTDGIDDVCRYAQSPGVTEYPFTLSAWVKSTNSTEYDHVVYIGDGSSNSRYFSIGIRNGTAFITARNTSEKKSEDTEEITDGNWHLITGVFENATIRRLYVDGVLGVIDTAAANSVSIVTTINRFSAGALDRSSLANQFGGTFDDVRLYGKALSASDVKDMYYSVIPDGDTIAPTSPTNLISTGITETSFNLLWTASTDNVGVTGYEVFANGVSKGTTTNPSMEVTGLTCNTAYSMIVKARDAARNWSDASPALNVSTTDCPTNISETSQNYNVKVYPNPLSNGILTVHLGFEAHHATLSVYSIAGQLVYLDNFSGVSKEISGNLFNKGVYIITLKTNQGTYNRLFIKK